MAVLSEEEPVQVLMAEALPMASQQELAQTQKTALRLLLALLLGRAPLGLPTAVEQGLGLRQRSRRCRLRPPV